MLWRKRPYDRGRVMADADRARGRGRLKKAVALYLEVLAADPGDLAAHTRVAPLLARLGRRREAIASFRAAAEGQARAGFPDRAVALQVQSTGHFPDDLTTWQSLLTLQLPRGRAPDAVAAMLQGARRLMRSRQHAEAALLLERIRRLEPWQPEATLLLARVHWRSGLPAEALALLDALAARTGGATRRRARRLAFRVRPTPARLWRWARAAYQARRGAPAPPAARPTRAPTPAPPARPTPPGLTRAPRAP